MRRTTVLLIPFALSILAKAEIRTDLLFRPPEPISIVLGVRPAKPFQARFTQVHVTIDPDGRRLIETATGMIFRDRAGRVRREFETETRSGEVLRKATIYDPIGRRMHLLNLASKTAVSTLLMDAAMDSKPGWIYSGFRPVKNEPVELKHIDGIECRKLRLTPGQVEVWISDELGQPLRESMFSATEEYTWKLSGIRQVEPASSLFTVPEDFQMTDSILAASMRVVAWPGSW